MPAAVVEVDLPPDRDERPYETARNTLSVALDLTRERLAERRAHRDDVNAEIKLLVEEAELLDRMWRIAAAAAKKES